MQTTPPVSSEDARDRRYTGPARRVDIEGHPLFYIEGGLSSETAWDNHRQNRHHDRALSSEEEKHFRDRFAKAPNDLIRAAFAMDLLAARRGEAGPLPARAIEIALAEWERRKVAGSMRAVPSSSAKTPHRAILTDRQRAIADELGFTAEQRERYAERVSAESWAAQRGQAAAALARRVGGGQ